MDGRPPAAVGVFGKLPVLGDFLDRGLPRDLVDAWHGWLVAGLAASRGALGPTFEPAYMAAPVWRVVVPAGTLATAGLAGVVLPSVDAVGRLFPLTLAVPLAADAGIDPLDAEPWLDALEASGRAGLALDEHPERWIVGLAGLPPPPALDRRAETGWLAPDGSGGEDVVCRVRRGLLRLAARGRTLLWSQGSPFVRPAAWIADRPPEGEAFARLLADPQPRAEPVT
jgi:type VI secretion system protein ImpM